MKCKDVGSNLFLFVFNNVVDRDRTLRVRAYGIPSVYVSQKVGKIIGQSLGALEEVECVKDRGYQGSYVRMRV
ncbi:hypothetical protein CFOL_v3_32423 [Cephalotus follicularis]|uniref:Uncharacterized protein n=1 Tax=Cephalotus follicularis TaxID=3775 RepID=A0A1Q3D981_CEPFO|nr:hypothetical protein CFOL_v3_32423 [Cephalotus follicularis]